MPLVTTYSPLFPKRKDASYFTSKHVDTDSEPRSPIIHVGMLYTGLQHKSLAASPVSSPRLPKQDPTNLRFSPDRLRSNSGLAHHTNESLLGQYTDYFPNGSVRTPESPVIGIEDYMSSAFWTGSSGTSTPEVPRLKMPYNMLSHEAFGTAMKNPESMNKFWAFATTRGYGSYIEFLLKIRDYTESLEQVIGQMSAISTTYTSATASSPLPMPSLVKKHLGQNTKHIMASTMPNLSDLYLESKTYIEEKLAKEVFPDFVQHQLAQSMSVTLALNTPNISPLSQFSGLSGAFTISDPTQAQCPITCSSDQFERFSGRTRSEVFSRNLDFLNGPHTDRGAVKRIHEALVAHEESVNVVLSYRKDGEMFYNLVYNCPILDARGHSKLWLSFHEDVSASIGDAQQASKVLRFSPNDATEIFDKKSEEISRAQAEAPSRSPSPKAAKKGLFGHFKKQSGRTSPSAESTARPETPLSPESIRAKSHRTILKGLSLGLGACFSAYHRFMVLQHVPSSLPTSLHFLEGRESPMEKKAPPKLNIMYCSQAVIDALGLGMAADAILQKDVFDVLAEQANSPSVTKAFKSQVRDTVLYDGKTASMELSIREANLRKASLAGGSTEGKSEDGASREWEASRPGNKMGKMMTYWTPMKDLDGETPYVILVLSPMYSQELR